MDSRWNFARAANRAHAKTAAARPQFRSGEEARGPGSLPAKIIPGREFSIAARLRLLAPRPRGSSRRGMRPAVAAVSFLRPHRARWQTPASARPRNSALVQPKAHQDWQPPEDYRAPGRAPG